MYDFNSGCLCALRSMAFVLSKISYWFVSVAHVKMNKCKESNMLKTQGRKIDGVAAH